MKLAQYIEMYKDTPGLGKVKALYMSVPHKQGNGLAELPARKDADGDPFVFVADVRSLEKNGKIITPGYKRISHEAPDVPKADPKPTAKK